MLGYVPENIVLYSDMTSRELLQQRSTLPNGDTSWTLLPLVTAARKGHLAILDGIHQLDIGTLAVIKRFSLHVQEIIILALCSYFCDYVHLYSWLFITSDLFYI